MVCFFWIASDFENVSVVVWPVSVVVWPRRYVYVLKADVCIIETRVKSRICIVRRPRTKLFCTSVGNRDAKSWACRVSRINVLAYSCSSIKK